MTRDILTILIGYIVTVSAVLLWTFLSKQDRVPRTRRTAVMVLVRTLPLFATFLLICHGLHVSVLAVMLGLVLFLFVVFLSPFGNFEATLGILGILYVLKQWVLGWPDKQEMVLEPPPLNSRDSQPLSSLIGQLGVTSGALRPSGHVVIAGDQYSACSDQGYVDVDVKVRVVGARDSQLIVRPVEDDSCLKQPAD